MKTFTEIKSTSTFLEKNLLSWIYTIFLGITVESRSEKKEPSRRNVRKYELRNRERNVSHVQRRRHGGHGSHGCVAGHGHHGLHWPVGHLALHGHHGLHTPLWCAQWLLAGRRCRRLGCTLAPLLSPKRPREKDRKKPISSGTLVFLFWIRIDSYLLTLCFENAYFFTHVTLKR